MRTSWHPQPGRVIVATPKMCVITWEVCEDEEGGIGLGGGEGEVLAGDGRPGLLHGEVEVHGLPLVVVACVCAPSVARGRDAGCRMQDAGWFRVARINV